MIRKLVKLHIEQPWDVWASMDLVIAQYYLKKFGIGNRKLLNFPIELAP